MKKIIFSICSVAIIAGMISCSGVAVNPELAACKEGCQKAFEKCKEEAGKDEAKIKACEVARDACCEKCRQDYQK